MNQETQTKPKRCDCCGRVTLKFWRNYNDKSFCAACYNREFKLRPCSNCTTSMRAHKDNANPICAKCSRQKPCIRCGKVSKSLGKVTKYGNVCPSCSFYFNEHKTCSNCGKTALRLSKKEGAGFYEPVCDKCLRLDHKACQACSRHRKLNLANDGRLLCKVCIAKGEKPCSQCKQPMPAGLGKICRNCYYSNLLFKRTRTCIEALSNQFHINLFSEFSSWLEKDVGINKAAITVNKHFPFFYNLNISYPNHIPEYGELLNQPDIFELRTNSLPVRFLCTTGRLTIDLMAKNEAMNQQTIQRYLSRKTGFESLDKLLADYHTHLSNKKTNSKTSLHSIRLALSPVMKLLASTALVKKEHLDQNILNRFLKSTPGQYAAIYGFVMFCKKRGEPVEMQKKQSITKLNSRQKLEKALIAHIRKQDDILSNVTFMTVALAYFHRTNLKIARSIIMSSNSQEINNGLICLKLNGRKYLIPNMK